MRNKPFYGTIGIQQHRISCVIGIYPEERLQEQDLFVDLQIKIDLSRCLASGRMEDSVDYVSLACLCTELAQKQKYFLLEHFAADVLERCRSIFGATWAWVKIQKPAAISTAAYAFVEVEHEWGGSDDVGTCHRGS